MKSRFKKLQALLLAFTCLAGTLPVYAAHTTSTFEEENREYFYTNTFDEQVEKGNMGFDTALANDPDGDQNKVMHVTDADGAGTAESGRSAMSLSGLSEGYTTTPTYKSLGVDPSKQLIMEMDIYLPQGLLDEVKTFQIGAPTYNSASITTLENSEIKVKKKDESTFLFTRGSTTKDMPADNWYNIKYAYTINSGAWRVYIDGTSFASGTIPDWGRTTIDNVAQGIKIWAVGGPLETGFYIDNVSLYQIIPQDITFGISDGAIDVSPDDGINVDLGSKVSAEVLAGKFKAIAADNSSVQGIVNQVDDTNVSVVFMGLEENAPYTLEFSGYSSPDVRLNKASITFTTKAPTDITVLADVEDGAELEAGDNEINLTFSKKVALEDVLSKITLIDEDNNDITFTGDQISDTEIKINMPKLSELTGFTFKLDESLTSEEEGLPLREGLEITFRTKQQRVQAPEDPYEPSVNSDGNILLNSDMDKTWHMSTSSATTDFDGDITVLSTTTSATSFYPNSPEAGTIREDPSGKYSQETGISFNFDIKIPDKTVTTAFQIRMMFRDATQNNSTDKKDYGSWLNEFYIRYNKNGIDFYKNTLSSKAVTLYSFDEVPENEWFNIKGFVDMKTGIITMFRNDGTTSTLNMDVAAWAGEDSHRDRWGYYMYFNQIYFYVGKESEVQLKNVDVRRLSNTLSVTGANFEHGEYYVDPSNITLEFNDEIVGADLEKIMVITDSEGNTVDCDVKVNSDGEICNLSIDGLKTYTEYTMTIEGLLSKSLRRMPEKFERSFVTKKRSDVFIDTVDSRAVLNTYNKRISKADKIEYTAVLKNEGNTTPDVLGAVVVYDQNDCIMKMQYKDLTVGTTKFVLEDIPLGANCVRVFAWNKKDGVISSLLHAPDTLQTVTRDEYELDYTKTAPEFTTAIVDSSKSLIGVSAKTDETDGVCTIIMLDGENTPLSQASTKTVGLSYSEVGKEFGNVFSVNAESGMYTIYVITDNNIYNKNFNYLKLNDLVENYIKKIANGTITQSEIYEKTVEFNSGIGIDFTTDFVSDRDKNLFEKRMYDRRNLLTGPTDAEYAEQLLKNIDFAKREIKYLNELSEISYYGLIKAKLDEGLEFTNIDFKAYDNLSNNKQSAVMGKMTSQTFTDGDALKDYFDKLVKNPPSTDGGNSDPESSDRENKKDTVYSKNNAYVPQNVPVVNNTASDVFTDLAGYEWANESILYLARRGIINGITEDKFNPAGMVTREQFAKMVVLAVGAYKENAEPDFDDVNLDAWYASYIASAKKAGIVNGVDEVNFGVGQYIKREDMAVMIYRAFGMKNIVFTKSKMDFADTNSISEYAFEAISRLAGEGIINGMEDNTFAPHKYATRAEAAMLIKALEEGVN